MMGPARTAPSADDARRFVENARFRWHQRFELAPGVETPGTRNVAPVLAAAGIARDLTGMRVLDVGTANGAVAFEAERRGAAQVVAIDIVPPDVYGFDETASFLGSSVEFRRSTVYALAADEPFDVVFVGALHQLRHPLLALDLLAAATRPRGTIVVEAEVVDAALGTDAGKPAALFVGEAEITDDSRIWFIPTSATLLAWCGSSGFDSRLCAAWPDEAPTCAVVVGTRREGPARTLGGLPSSVDEVAVTVGELPIPPPEMRQLVGPTDVAAFDNPHGNLVFPELAPDAFRRVFDFGCGCGRVARMLLQQQPRPLEYTGVDLHRGMIEWCRENLAPIAPTFEFLHHDVFNPSFNPAGVQPPRRRFDVDDERFTLVNAHSVFTHILEEDVSFYLAECARIMEPTAVFRSTWFLFDKSLYPMMQGFQNALYINTSDPTNAVILDKTWLRERAHEAGLAIVGIVPPAIRGFQWTLFMRRAGADVQEVELPADTAPQGLARPPVGPVDAASVGLAGPE